MNNNKSIELSQPTAPGMHYTACYNQPFILVGFEESQAITRELRFRGYNAFSCDLQDCSGTMPEFHLKMDIFQAINLRKWDMIILHPPCTYTALCGIALRGLTAWNYAKKPGMNLVKYVTM